MADLFTWYEEKTTTTSAPPPKRRKRKRKEFKLNFDELFHRELYGEIPVAFSTPLPELAPYCGDIPSRLVPFHEAYAYKDYHCTLHFYTDDSLFLRVLRNPEKYLEFLQKCQSVIGTDLSQYADMPAEERYYSAYINSAFSAYLQRNNVNLIPNVIWSLPDSYHYCLSSMPRNSVIAINCKGIMKHDVSKYLWYKGYTTACQVLHPSLIVRYGTKMPCEYTDNSIYFENERLNFMRYGR